MADKALVERGIERRAAMLEFIRQYHADRGYSPTINEIRDAVGPTSTNAVRSHLLKLRDEGAIDMTPRVARSIVVRG